jgi:hypothetical protein
MGAPQAGFTVESAMVELAILVLAAWLVWSLVSRRISGSTGRPGLPAEPGDPAGRTARLRPRPGRGSAAIALAEPEEEEDELP